MNVPNHMRLLTIANYPSIFLETIEDLHLDWNAVYSGMLSACSHGNDWLGDI